MKNQLLRFGALRLSAIGILNAFTILANVTSGLVLARVLTKDAYGALIAFFATFGMLRLLANFGLGANVSRDVAQSEHDPQSAYVSMYSTGVVRLVSILVVLAVGLVGAELSGRPELLFGTLVAVLASGADFTFAILAGTRRTLPVGIMTVIQPVAYLALVAAAILFGARQVETFMGLFAISFGFMLATGLLLVVKERIVKRIRRNYFQLLYLKRVFGFILASYAASLLSQLWSSLASGSLGWLGHYEEAAEFGVAFSIVSLPVAVIGPTILTIFFPEASYRYQKAGKKEVLTYFRNTAPWIVGITFGFSVCLFVFADQITPFFYGEKYLDSALYLRILSGLPITAGVFPALTLSLFAVDKAWKSLVGLGLQAVILLAAILLNISALSATELSRYVMLSSIAGVVAQFFLFQKTLRM